MHSSYPLGYTKCLHFLSIQLDDVEETVSERLLGLMEMMPDKFWVMLGRSFKFSYWFIRRTGWVLGTSLTLLVLSPLLEQQRVEVEEMQNLHKKQVRNESHSRTIDRSLTIVRC